MNVGDRVRTLNSPKITGTVVEIEGRGAMVRIQPDRGYYSSSYNLEYRVPMLYGDNAVELIARTDEKNYTRSDVLAIVQGNRDAVLDEIEKFRMAVQAGTLGDFSDIGFMYEILVTALKGIVI